MGYTNYNEPVAIYNIQMVSDLYNKTLNNYSYNISFSSRKNSINFSIKGFSNKLNVITKKIISIITSFTDFDHQVFMKLKENQKKSLDNHGMSTPYKRLNYNLNSKLLNKFRNIT